LSVKGINKKCDRSDGKSSKTSASGAGGIAYIRGKSRFLSRSNFPNAANDSLPL